MTWAAHAVTLRAVGRCRNSFGPWAFDSGPSTPVIRNCASGYRSPSIDINGMPPPIPMPPAGLPKWLMEAAVRASASHGSVTGAFHPFPPLVAVTVTVAFDGGSALSTSISNLAASPQSTVGGNRNESPRVVKGRKTLPASASDGTPSMPT